MQKQSNEIVKFGRDNRSQAIENACETIVDRYSQGQVNTAIDIPPRFGKTNIIYAVACILRTMYPGLSTLVFAPWKTLATQVRDQKKIDDHLVHYPTSSGVVFNRDEARLRNPNWIHQQEESTFISSTLGLARNNLDNLVDGIVAIIEAGLPRPLVFIDECHLLKQEQSWGRMYESIVDAGAHVVLLTGTPFDTRKRKLAGRDHEDGEVKTRDHVHKSQPRLENGKKIRTVTESVISTTSSIVSDPHCEVTWREAWDCGALLHLDFELIDSKVELTGQDKFDGKLSEMPEGMCRKHARKIVESDNLIQECCKVTIQKLKMMRKRGHIDGHAAQWLVTTGSDLATEHVEDASDDIVHVNRHAKQVRKHLEAAAEAAGMKGLIVKIATLKNADAEPDNLKDFVNHKADILIVKTMGLVGLDQKSIVGMTDLSTIRNESPTKYQALTRPATVAEGKEVAFIVLPGTELNKQLKDEFGAMGGTAKDSKSETIKTYDEEVEDTDELDTVLTLSESQFTEAVDTKGNAGEQIDEARLNHARMVLRSALGDAELWNLISSGMVKIESPPEPEVVEPVNPQRGTDLTSKRAGFRKDINDNVKKYCNLIASYPDDGDAWVECRKRTIRELKKQAGINPGIELERIVRISDLKKLAELSEEL